MRASNIVQIVVKSFPDELVHLLLGIHITYQQEPLHLNIEYIHQLYNVVETHLSLHMIHNIPVP